jgi:hypothetical protein
MTKYEESRSTGELSRSTGELSLSRYEESTPDRPVFGRRFWCVLVHLVRHGACGAA